MKSHDFYVAGESYGGHWAPGLIILIFFKYIFMCFLNYKKSIDSKTFAKSII